MKPSKRNLANQRAKAERQRPAPPLVSKYAAKYAPVDAPTAPMVTRPA